MAFVISANALGSTIEVNGISDSAAVRLFRNMILSAYEGKAISDKRHYVSLHLQITIAIGTVATILVFTSDNIYISATPSAGMANFIRFRKRVEAIAIRCVEPFGKKPRQSAPSC